MEIPPSAIEPEEIDRVLALAIERLATRRESLMALEQDESAFLPASFLEVATQRSMSVCRIARYFSLHSFKAAVGELISDAQVIAEELRRLIQNIDHLLVNEKEQFLKKLLKEIFSIPEAVAEGIFNVDPNQQDEKDFQLEILLETLLKKLQNISATQLSKFNPIAIGTGFLVGGSHLMTNHHVVSTAEEAKECVAQFNYVQDALGGVRTVIEYELDPDLLFVSNSSLDYTLVQLKAGILKKQPGYTFGWIPLIEDDKNVLPAIDSETIEKLRLEKPEIQNPFKDPNLNPKEKIKELSGDRVFIIQHPRGERQKIAQSDNKVLSYSDPDFIGGLLKNYIRYTTASDYGSSGAPVLNGRGELVALNHAVIISKQNFLDFYYKWYCKIQNNQSLSLEVLDLWFISLAYYLVSGSASRHKQEFVYQGIRLCRIIEDLKVQSINNLKLRTFIEDFIITAEQLKFPPLPVALEFDGISSVVNLTGSDKDESPNAAFATANNEGDFRLRTVNTKVTVWSQVGLEIESFEIRDSSVEDLAISPDGKLLVIALYTGNSSIIQIRELDKILAGKDALLVSWPADDFGVSQLLFHPQSEILATSHGMSPVLKLWKVTDGHLLKEISNIDGQNQWFRGLSFSSDGKFLAAAGSESLKVGKIWIWSLANLESEEALQLLDCQDAHGEMAWSVSFSPDGQKLVSGGRDFPDFKVNLWTWNGQSLTLSNDLKGSEASLIRSSAPSGILGVAFSPNGDFFGSASSDGIIRLWNKEAKEIQTLRETESVREIRFSEDGGTLASFGDTRITIYKTIDSSSDQPSGFSKQPFYLLNLGSSPQMSFNPQVQSLKAPPSDEERVNRYYSFGSNKLEDIKPFSIEAFVIPYSSGVILSKSRGLTQGEYIVYITKEGFIVFSIFFNTKEGLQKEYRLITQLRKVRFGEPNHIAVTYGVEEVENKKFWLMKIYLNGEIDEKIKESQRNPNFLKIEELDIQNSDPYLPVLLGAASTIGRTGSEESRKKMASNFFRGIVSEIRIWNKSLTQGEIQKNMFRRLTNIAEQLKKDKLVGYWRFEDIGSRSISTETSTRNYISSQLLAQVFNAKGLTATSISNFPYPLGLYFDGKNSYVECSQGQSLGVACAITIEAWIKHDYGNGLIVWHGGCWEDSGYCLFLHEDRIRVELQDTNKRPTEKTTIDTKDCMPDDNLWHHVAFSWNKETKEIIIYIDAHRQDIISVGSPHAKSRLIDGSYQNVGVFEGPIVEPNYPLNIGRNVSQRDENKRYFRGEIAEVRIWNIVRSQSEIKSNIDRRLQGDEEHLVGYWRLDDGTTFKEDANELKKAKAYDLSRNQNEGQVYGAQWYPSQPSINLGDTISP